MKISTLIIIFSLTLFFSHQADAQRRWYVSTTGSDANNGMTTTTAWRSMQFANNNAAVVNGDTISVLAGNYNENVVISKSLKFYGPNFNVSPNTGAVRNAEAVITMSPNIFEAYTPNTSIEVKGFKLMGGAPIYDENHSRVNPTDAIAVLFEKNWIMQAGSLFAGTQSVWRTINIIDNKFENINLTATNSGMQINADANVTITDNQILQTGFAGILLDGVISASVLRNTIRNTPNEAAIQLAGIIGTATVSQNDIQFANSLAGADAGGIRIFGSQFTGAIRITNNVVRGARNGFAVRNGENITGKNILVNNNFFDASNTAYSIYNGGTGTLDATCNLNAATTPPVAAKIFGAVTFQPYLTSATDSDPSSMGFQPATGTCNGFDPTFAITIADIRGFTKNQGIQVEWSVQSEGNIARYELEKSANGQQFTKVASVNPIASGTATSNYNWFDANPLNGINYYRIAMVDKDSKIKYTQTVSVRIGKGAFGMLIYPNPITGKQFILQINNMQTGLYTVTFFNKLGQQVFTKSIQTNSLSSTQTVDINNLAAGTYSVRIAGNGNNFVQQVIKND